MSYIYMYIQHSGISGRGIICTCEPIYCLVFFNITVVTHPVVMVADVEYEPIACEECIGRDGCSDIGGGCGQRADGTGLL